MTLLWYAAYGSNMHLARLTAYLSGGRPAGAARSYPGCRDASPPARSLPVMLPGQLYFAMESRAWTGGLALYDPAGPGETAARAHLLTLGQFSDIAAQEMYRDPGADLDLDGVLTYGRVELGPGRYETVVRTGTMDDLPVLTFTASWAHTDVPSTKPVAAYLRHLATGLLESHGWPLERVAEYLATRPGAAGVWTAAEIAALVSEPGRPRAR